MTVLSAGVFAASSFAAMNAYARDSCVVCWSPDSRSCEFWEAGITALTDGISHAPALSDSEPVMWLSCYEHRFRSKFDDLNGETGRAVTKDRCLSAVGQYETYINLPPVNSPNPLVNTSYDPPVDYPQDGVYAADASVYFAESSCRDLVGEDIIPGNVPRAADSLEYTPICLVRNDGSDNETVNGIGILAPNATGLLPGACPAN